MPNIVDVLIHKNSYDDQIFLVIDTPLNFIYERKGNFLGAEDGGFYDCLGYEHSNFSKAFAGREFDIPMKDGTKIHATGQWWSVYPIEFFQDVDIVSVGAATLEELNKCYVFSSAKILKSKLDGWLASNKPSYDYRKYDKTRG